MGFSDNFYKKVEQKTNVNKDTILSLASFSTNALPIPEVAPVIT